MVVNAQVKNETINAISKKLVMLDAKSDGSVINIRYDSLIVKKETMRDAIMSYLSGTLLKTEEIRAKYDAHKAGIIDKYSEEDLEKSKQFLFKISKIGEKQKVLIFEKMDKADNIKKNIIHSRVVYYLKLDDDLTDGNYQSDYYYTLQGNLIPNIYEYFLENIN